MTAALEGGEWSAACPGHTLPPGKTRYPFYRRLGGPQGRSGRVENLVPTGIRSRTIQPVVSRYYTNWAAQPMTLTLYLKNAMSSEFVLLELMNIHATLNVIIRNLLLLPVLPYRMNNFMKQRHHDYSEFLLPVINKFIYMLWGKVHAGTRKADI